MKLLIRSALFLVLVLSLVGCSSNNQIFEVTEEENNNPPEKVEETEEEEPAETDGGLTLEEALEQSKLYRGAGGNYFFMVHDGAYYPFDVAVYSQENGFSDQDIYLPASGFDGNETIPIINLNKGDKLISTRSNEFYYIIPVNSQGYCNGTRAITVNSYNEVNGVDLKASGKTALEVLEDSNIIQKLGYFTSPKATSFTCGIYRGVDFEEMTIDLNIPFLETEKGTTNFGEPLYPYSADVEKTKDGYFIINMPSLEPGLYIMISNAIGECIAFTIE